MKKVLVTGVSRGIGRCIAENYLKGGFELWGTFYRCEKHARELEDLYGNERVHLLGPYDFCNLD